MSFHSNRNRHRSGQFSILPQGFETVRESCRRVQYEDSFGCRSSQVGCSWPDWLALNVMLLVIGQRKRTRHFLLRLVRWLRFIIGCNTMTQNRLGRAKTRSLAAEPHFGVPWRFLRFCDSKFTTREQEAGGREQVSENRSQERIQHTETSGSGAAQQKTARYSSGRSLVFSFAHCPSRHMRLPAAYGQPAAYVLSQQLLPSVD